MAKKYYWLKLRNDWFSDKRVKKLRSIAGGDTYTIIYLKMQLLSLKNEGKLFFEGVEDDFASELALDLDEDVENVKVTVAFLMKNGLLELNDADEYLLTDVPDTIGSETAGAERVRRFRSNKKALQCNADVTERNISNKKCNTEIDIEKEIDIEIDNIVSNDTICQTDVRQSDIEQVITAWNNLGLSQISKITAASKRGQGLKARIREYGVDKVLEAISNISHSTFLRGGNKTGWTITLDWLVKPNNFPKVLENQYVDKTNDNSETRASPINNSYVESIKNRMDVVDQW